MTSILARHRIAALVGVALFATPLVASAMITNPTATPVTTTTTNGMTSFAPIVTADKPAVVTITTKMKAANVEFDGDTPFSGNSPFDEQFRQFFGQQGIPMPQPQQRQPMAQALGSGFIIDANGIIVTNNHVIDGAVDIKVTLDDGTELPAKLIGADPKSDLAVLKISASRQLPTVKWGDSDHMNAGDPVLAIGNPFGLGTTVTSGIVSARGRDLNNGPYDDFIQVDAAINHGNSGGPLMNSQGEVVGINTAIYSPSGGNVGIGFAIPAEQAKPVVLQLMKGERIHRGYLGVGIQPMTDDIAASLNLPKDRGEIVSRIEPGQPAARAGVQQGDVILKVNGQEITPDNTLSYIVAGLPVGSRVSIDAIRNGKPVTLTAVLAERPPEDQLAAAAGDEDEGGAPPQGGQAAPSSIRASLGLSLQTLTPQIVQQLGLTAGTHGVVVTGVDQSSDAGAKGIQPRDVILAIAQRPVSNVAEAAAAIDAAKKGGFKTVLLLVQRGNHPATYLGVELIGK